MECTKVRSSKAKRSRLINNESLESIGDLKQIDAAIDDVQVSRDSKAIISLKLFSLLLCALVVLTLSLMLSPSSLIGFFKSLCSSDFVFSLGYQTLR